MTPERDPQNTIAEPPKKKRGRPKKVVAPAPLQLVEAPGKPNKIQSVIALLRRPDGATIADIQAITGWQPHSVRGAISGTLKKKLGLTVLSSKAGDDERRYRIETADGAA